MPSGRGACFVCAEPLGVRGLESFEGGGEQAEDDAVEAALHAEHGEFAVGTERELQDRCRAAWNQSALTEGAGVSENSGLSGAKIDARG